MKKIFFITDAADGSYYYRVEVFKRYTKKFKVSSNADYQKGTVKDPFELLNELFASDIVVFLRPTQRDYFLLVPILKYLGVKVAFSSDDHLASLDKKNPAYGIKKNIEIYDLFLKSADFGIASTEILNKEYLKNNKTIYTIPNLIDFEEYESQYRRKNNREISIGLVGSVQTAENTESFIYTLKKIQTLNKRIKLVFFGADKKTEKTLKNIFNANCEFVPFVNMHDYSKSLATLDLDIALMPRKDNYFNRCKSNCKYLEMSALKIATVAQGFKDGQSPYQADIKNGDNGYIAIAEDDWYKAINSILKNQNKLESVKEKASEYVKENFDIAKKINLWDEVFEKESVGLKKKGKFEADFLENLIEGFTNLDSQRVKNMKKEIKFLNSEIDRIRGRLPYRLAAKASSSLKKFR